MVGNHIAPGSPRSISARFFLWTIRKQDRISRWFTMNVWSAVSAILAIALVGVVAWETALQIILVGGMAATGLIWILIERRRSWLLRISDEKLKAEVHRTMIDYLCTKLGAEPACRKHLSGDNAWPVA